MMITTERERVRKRKRERNGRNTTIFVCLQLSLYDIQSFPPQLMTLGSQNNI